MIVAKRITDKAFEQLQVGDVCMLAGTQSVFPVDEVDEVLVKRLAEFDVDITAPMWGSGRLMTSHSVEIFELSALAEFKTFTEGLEKFGLKQERRKIRLTVQMPKISLDNNTVVLSFCLPSGCYATTILRELIQYQDLTQRVDHNHRESVN